MKQESKRKISLTGSPLVSRRARGSHGLLLNGDGSHRLLLSGDEGAHTSPYLVTKSSPRFAKVAFTLAEVLITLGVIGVVAAMTLPTLIQNYKKHEVETKLAKFYTVMNQAVTRAEAVYGDKKEWGAIGNGFELDENGNPDRTKSIPKAWFDKYLKLYLNVADEKTGIDGRVLLTFSDGTFATISSNSIIFYVNKKYYKETVNQNGTGSVDESGAGTTIFYFAMWPTWKAATYHYNKGIEPYANTVTSIKEFKNASWGGCYNEKSPNQGLFCCKLIQLNGWKIPKDYPLKF